MRQVRPEEVIYGRSIAAGSSVPVLEAGAGRCAVKATRGIGILQISSSSSSSAGDDGCNDGSVEASCEKGGDGEAGFRLSTAT
jgi:hypothetical protein